MPDRRILIDLTDFRSFRRQHQHLTGIQRVVAEVGRRLRDAEHLDVLCVYWDGLIDAFYLADPRLLDPDEPTTAVSADGADNPEDDDIQDATETDDAKRRLGLGMLVKGKIGAAASLTRRVLGSWPLARRAVGNARRALSRNRPERVVFRSDDAMIILGTVWENPRMLERVATEHERIGFDVATMVYDLIPLEHPEFVFKETVKQFNDYLTRILRLSAVVFVISDATKRVLEKWCENRGIVATSIQVTYLGDDFTRPEVSVRPKTLPPGEFVLAVSTVEPRKNYLVLYQAVKQAELEDKDLPMIVIVGRPGWRTSDLQELLKNDPALRGRLVWMNKVVDAELAWLYENALFTLFPSIIEGWGLPISESISFGKFCISSGLSSMPEIAGDLIAYASPYDPAAWAREIHRYHADRSLLNERVGRMLREYRARRWDDTAQTIEAALAVFTR